MGRITQFASHLAGSAFGGKVSQVMFEPQREYNFSFEVSFDQPQKKNKKSLISLKSLKSFISTEVIDLAIDSAFLPTIKFDKVEYRDINKSVAYAGDVQTTGGKIVVSDYILSPVMSTIDKWVREVYDYETDEAGLPDDYKKTANINLTGSMAIPERVWEITGVWPTSISYGNLDMNSSERVKISLELSYDTAVYVGSSELKFIKSLF